MKKLVLSFMLCIPMTVFAISENNYQEEYKTKIIPVLNSYQYGSLEGENAVALNYATYASNPAASKCLVILPGRSEAVEKYAEVIYDLDHGPLAGAMKYILLDHRGQGSSGRMISTDSEKGYVEKFENYALDLKSFMDKVVATKGCNQTYLLAHSLGAGIAVDFMQQHPQYFDRAALVSPMLKIQTAPYKYGVAQAIVTASVLAGRGKKYAPGQKGFDPTRDFANNTFTSSPERYEMAMGIYDVFPRTRLGGSTNRWVYEVMNGTHEMRKHYDALKVPMRVFYAGIEKYSEVSEMVSMCKVAPYCNAVFFETSKHEVLMDRDVNRNLALNELVKFLN